MLFLANGMLKTVLSLQVPYLSGQEPAMPGLDAATPNSKAAAVRLLFCMPCRDWCWLDEWMGGQEESVDEERRTGE